MSVLKQFHFLDGIGFIIKQFGIKSSRFGIKMSYKQIIGFNIEQFGTKKVSDS